MIELAEISVRFPSNSGDFFAVREASLNIPKGEIFGIVGSSGAGKSTLLRTINLLERPSNGSVKIDGEDITRLQGGKLRAKRQRIGMIFQHFNLMHTKNVFDNVAFALLIAGSTGSEIQKRVPELLELVGLADKAEAYPSQLSGGQKQRVGIARALANRPDLLLCDEPTSALDLETSASILQLLGDINRKLSLTIVIISHEMSVIKSICHRVAVMDQGLIVEEGPVYEVFANPMHAFTKQLVDRTFNLEIPERHLANFNGALLKVLFRGDRAEEPLLSRTVAEFEVTVNILHGKIEYITDRPLGLLVVSVEGEKNTVRKAIEYIKENTARVEIIHE